MSNIKTPEKILWVVMSIGLLTAEFIAVRHDHKGAAVVRPEQEKP